MLGVLPGIVGTWQAGEGIKMMAGVGEPLSGKLLLWNALTMNVQTLRLAADPNSRAVCADLPHKGVRKSGIPNIIGLLASQASHGG